MSEHTDKVQAGAFFKLSYGLFVLSARDGQGKDNACIINTAQLITDQPKRVTIAVNKANYTHDLVMRTGAFNLSVLPESAPFSVFEHFGFRTGRECDKFDGGEQTARSENGLKYLTEHCNAVISGRVSASADNGTHTLFTAEVTEAKTLSDEPSATYDYYFKHIKPKPEAKKRKGWICKICGYVYEGDELPPDFVCPICKHGAEDFEPLA